MKTKENLGLLLMTAVKKAIEVNDYTDPLKAICPPKSDKSWYKIGIRPAEFKRAPQSGRLLFSFMNLLYSAGADFTDKVKKNRIKEGII